jgi:2-polyprenyl-6-methoxyphenol hydroxylase-like FAD-dependent oxidoreductase
MMLALLLARAGVDVTVLEKHGDFLRDFRGDTVHPSTLEVMHEIGVLDAFLERPHDKARDVRAVIGGTEVVLADFSRLRTRCGFIALMPQWEFLDFLRDEAALYPGFHLLMRAQATSLIETQGRVVGLRAETPTGEIDIGADLVIGADGRHSTLREAAGLRVRNLGAPIDVLWMRITKRPPDPPGVVGRIGTGHFMAMLDRRTYWQCAYVIRKGGGDTLRERGLEAFRADVVALAPFLADRIEADLATWDDIKLLAVTVDRLERWWKPGLLCIGDAAHAMSPIGGVGINLAVQDAVAASNILAQSLANPRTPADTITSLLARVQQRRLFPARVTQAVQVAIQNRIFNPLLDSSRPPRLPMVVKLLNRFPALRVLPAYAVGVGVRAEHVHSPAPARSRLRGA